MGIITRHPRAFKGNTTAGAIGGNDANTVLLLECNGSDGSTTFTDVSVGGSTHTMTAQGDAQVDTAIRKFGSGALLLDGTGDYLTTPNSADFDVGAGPYTWDWWGYFNTTPTGQYWMGWWDDGANKRSWYIYAPSLDQMQFAYSINGTDTLGANSNTGLGLSTGTWYHFAVVRYGASYEYIKWFINGTGEGVTNIGSPVTIYNANDQLEIGSVNGAAPINGSMDEIRFSNIARWSTSDFTPPSQEYD